MITVECFGAKVRYVGYIQVRASYNILSDVIIHICHQCHAWQSALFVFAFGVMKLGTNSSVPTNPWVTCNTSIHQSIISVCFQTCHEFVWWAFRDQRNYFSRQLIVKCAAYIQLWNLAPGFTMLAHVLGNSAIMMLLHLWKLAKCQKAERHHDDARFCKAIKTLNCHWQGTRLCIYGQEMCYLNCSGNNASRKTGLPWKRTHWLGYLLWNCFWVIITGPN